VKEMPLENIAPEQLMLHYSYLIHYNEKGNLALKELFNTEKLNDPIAEYVSKKEKIKPVQIKNLTNALIKNIDDVIQGKTYTLKDIKRINEFEKKHEEKLEIIAKGKSQGIYNEFPSFKLAITEEIKDLILKYQTRPCFLAKLITYTAMKEI
jgi:hypothetical protein